ncbi:MAG: hypothetical protein ACI80N_004310, partial [Gammaproteobacteria bacterium]
MGEHRIQVGGDGEQMRGFVRALLDDVQALECILSDGLIEADVRRIGAEQEMVLIDESLRPATTAMKILDRVEDGRITTELGIFNLEANLEPRVFGSDGLSRMEREMDELLARSIHEPRGETPRFGLWWRFAGIGPAGDLFWSPRTPMFAKCRQS